MTKLTLSQYSPKRQQAHKAISFRDVRAEFELAGFAQGLPAQDIQATVAWHFTPPKYEK